MLCLRGGFAEGARFVLGLVFAFFAVQADLLLAQGVPQPINLSNSVGGGFRPVMTLDTQGGVDVAWIGAGVFFARSLDGGATFATTTVLPQSAAPSGVQMGTDAAGNIELLWPNPPDDTHPGGSAFFSRSTDGGTTFSAASEFAPAAGLTSTSIQLAVEPGGGLDIVWLDLARANLWAVRSSDGGATFSAPVKVWAASGDLTDLQTKRAADGQLYIFWTHIASSTQCDI